MDRRRILLVAAGVAAAFFAVFILQKVPGSQASDDSRLMKQARREFAELNSRLPQYVDALTRLDSARVESPRTWSYYYTVEPDDSILSLTPEQFRRRIETSAVRTIRDNFNIGPGNKLGVTFQYYYSTRQGDWSAEVVVRPEMYQ
ncbi:MAG: hypothetical protein LIO77_01380 [Rikenellaceae bacterium]|nr:hypothetical protein [Rikenellaceae bacterium]